MNFFFITHFFGSSKQKCDTILCGDVFPVWVVLWFGISELCPTKNYLCFLRKNVIFRRTGIKTPQNSLYFNFLFGTVCLCTPKPY